MKAIKEICPECNGKGRYRKTGKICDFCKGAGYHFVSKTRKETE